MKRGTVFTTTETAKKGRAAYEEKKKKQCKKGCACAPKAQEPKSAGSGNLNN